MPSDSVVFRYLERFHDAGEEAKREAHRAFIPSPNDALKGLGKVKTGGLRTEPFASYPGHAGHGRLPGGEPQEGGAVQLQEVQGVSAARPTGQRPTWWMTLGFRALQRACGPSARVLKEALGQAVTEVYRVSQELLRCAEGRDERFHRVGRG